MSTDYEYKPGMLGNIKNLVRKANQNQAPAWMQNLEASVECDTDGDKANEPVSNDKQLEESYKKSTTRNKACGKKKEKPSVSSGLDELWNATKESKTKKDLKESQVWINNELYRKVAKLNVGCGKPVPTKHVINAILQFYLDEHKTETQKAMKPI